MITDHPTEMKLNKYFKVFFMRYNNVFNNISNIYVSFILIKHNYLELEFDLRAIIKSAI